MEELDEKKELKVTEPDIQKVSDETLSTVSGGKDRYRAHTAKFNYQNARSVDMKVKYAEEYCNLLDVKLVSPPKYPCPKCGSWDVKNYDPGWFYRMRVICTKCGAFCERDGRNPWELGELAS